MLYVCSSCVTGNTAMYNSGNRWRGGIDTQSAFATEMCCIEWPWASPGGGGGGGAFGIPPPPPPHTHTLFNLCMVLLRTCDGIEAKIANCHAKYRGNNGLLLLHLACSAISELTSKIDGH